MRSVEELPLVGAEDGVGLVDPREGAVEIGRGEFRRAEIDVDEVEIEQAPSTRGGVFAEWLASPMPTIAFHGEMRWKLFC